MHSLAIYSGVELLVIAWLWLLVVSGLFARHKKYRLNVSTVLSFPLLLGVIAYFPFLLLALINWSWWFSFLGFAGAL